MDTTRDKPQWVVVATTASPTATPQVGFEPNTDAGAFQIRAQGGACEVALEVAAAAEGQNGEAYQAGPGYRCTPEETSGQLPTVRSECSREGAGTIAFEVS